MTTLRSIQGYPGPQAPSEAETGDGSSEDTGLRSLVENAYRVALHLATAGSDAEALVETTAMGARVDLADWRHDYDAKVRFYQRLIRAGRERGWLQAFPDPDELGPDSVSSRPRHFDLDPRTHDEPDASAVHRAVQEMPQPYRTAVTLHLVEEITYEQLARVLDCPVGVARARLHRGRAILAEALGRVSRC